MSDATFAVDNAVPILSNAIFMQNLFAMLPFNYAIYFTLPLISQREYDSEQQCNGISHGITLKLLDFCHSKYYFRLA
jgi:hypothetical protein